MSILSYPERGKWGDAKWRGNCSGYIYRDLFTMLQPNVFVDPCVGSGTSVEVATELGIEAYGLDLHSGFNALRDSIRETVGKQADLVFSHPPYHDMIRYSGRVWGDTAHPDDLSACADHDEFMEKLHIMMLNQRDATRPGGYYGILIGDMRRKGQYISYQSEAIARMPSSELRSVLIKAQHNCASNQRQYNAMKLPYILHEYILLWQTPEVVRSVVSSLHEMAQQQKRRLTSTWRSVMKAVLIELGGRASLNEIYNVVIQQAPERIANNRENWKAAARRTLQQHKDIFEHVDRGQWALAA